MWTAVTLQPGGDKSGNIGQHAVLLLTRKIKRHEVPGGIFELLHQPCPANLRASCYVRQTHLSTVVGFSITAAERILQGYIKDPQDQDQDEASGARADSDSVFL